MTIGVRIHADGARASIKQARRAARTEISKAIARSGAYAVTVVRANASTGTHQPGRPHIPGTGPGPNVATGDYRRSATSTNHEAPGLAISDVSTAAVQAARLEFGFVGRDSDGRYFQQRPYPHFEPATPQIEAFANQQMDHTHDAITAAFGSTSG